MPLYQRKRAPRVSEIPIKFKPFIGDHKEIMRLSEASREPQATIARDLIAEALKARRMKAIGKDEMSREIVTVQKNAMSESQHEVKQILRRIEAQVGANDDALRRLHNAVVEEAEATRAQLGFVARVVRFVVTEVIVCRLLLREYVFVFYWAVVERLGKPVKDIRANFERRVKDFRGHAEEVMDRFDEAAGDHLHGVADEGSEELPILFGPKLRQEPTAKTQQG
jgi:hypothetical protein